MAKLILRDLDRFIPLMMYVTGVSVVWIDISDAFVVSFGLLQELQVQLYVGYMPKNHKSSSFFQ